MQRKHATNSAASTTSARRPVASRRLSPVALLSLVLVAVAVGPAPGIADAATPEPQPPNILLVVMDDMRADERVHMPIVSRMLADRGITFTEAVVPTPSCCPARAVLMSGKYVHNNHQFVQNPESTPSPYDEDDRMDLDHSIAVSLDGAGYRTVHLGKYLQWWHVRLKEAKATGDTGPDARLPPGWDEFYGHSGGYANRGYFVGSKGEPPETPGLVRLESKNWRNTTGVLTREAERYIDEFELDDATPWFMDLNIFAPHLNAAEAAELWCDPVDLADDTPFETAVRRLPALPDSPPCPPAVCQVADPPHVALEPFATGGAPGSVPAFLEAMRVGGAVLTDEERQHYVDCFTATRAELLTYADKRIGRVLRHLRGHQELYNSLVIFTSDNGHMIGERGLGKKFLPYDESVRVPLLVRWSAGGVAEGVLDDRLVSLVDIAPTISRAAGLVPATDSHDGYDLLGEHVRSWQLLEYYRDLGSEVSVRSRAAYRTAELLYVEWYTVDGERFLYELEDSDNDIFSWQISEDSAPEHHALLSGLRECVGTTGPQACPFGACASRR